VKVPVILVVRILLLVCVMLAATGSVRAEGIYFEKFETPAPGFAGQTYLDLARKIVPDLAPDGRELVGGEPITARRIATEPRDLPAKMRMRSFKAVSFDVAGKPRLLLLVANEPDPYAKTGWYAALALFDPSAGAQPIDIVDITFGVFSEFHGRESLDLGGGVTAVFTSSVKPHHWDARTTALLFVRDDRLFFVDTVDIMTAMPCSHMFWQNVDFDSVAADALVKSIRATIHEGSIASNAYYCDGDWPPENGEREVSARYDWDGAAKGFKRDSDVLAQLQEDTFAKY